MADAQYYIFSFLGQTQTDLSVYGGNVISITSTGTTIADTKNSRNFNIRISDKGAMDLELTTMVLMEHS